MVSMSDSGRMPDYPVGLSIDYSLRSVPVHAVYENAQKIAGLIREAILQAGLGKSNPAVPLADIVDPGMTVLMKPNWVVHVNNAGHGMECMVTHPAFIAAALEEVLAARPGRVILGDAPIQRCLWNQLVTPALRSQLSDIGARHGVPVEFVDFRRTVVPTGDMVDGVRSEVRDRSHYILFDLGTVSLLEPVAKPPGRFRVTDYDPEKLAQTHRPGKHQYLICREAFEADVIVSMPKLKLHRKAGLTGALKNLVGINGDKDFLPHHRVGHAAAGGDCYPNGNLLRHLAEVLWDATNRRIGKPTYRIFLRLASGVQRLATVGLVEHSLEGSWYGNDTCWRMVLDLNRILYYGRADGTMVDVPRRRICSLTDAIVCGEGEGPLRANPITVGAVTFCQSPAIVEFVHAALLRLDYRRIPLVRESAEQFRWPLSAPLLSGPRIFLEGECLTLDRVARECGVSAKPPKGWTGHIELPEGSLT